MLSVPTMLYLLFQMVTDLSYWRFYDQMNMLYDSWHNSKTWNYQFCYEGSYQIFKLFLMGAVDAPRVKGKYIL